MSFGKQNLKLHKISHLQNCMEFCAVMLLLDCALKVPIQHVVCFNFSVVFFFLNISYFVNLIFFFFPLTDFTAGVITEAVFTNPESSSQHPQAYGRFQ